MFRFCICQLSFCDLKKKKKTKFIKVRLGKQINCKFPLPLFMCCCFLLRMHAHVSTHDDRLHVQRLSQNFVPKFVLQNKGTLKERFQPSLANFEQTHVKCSFLGLVLQSEFIGINLFIYLFVCVCVYCHEYSWPLKEMLGVSLRLLRPM